MNQINASNQRKKERKQEINQASKHSSKQTSKQAKTNGKHESNEETGRQNKEIISKEEGKEIRKKQLLTSRLEVEKRARKEMKS